MWDWVGPTLALASCTSGLRHDEVEAQYVARMERIAGPQLARLRAVSAVVIVVAGAVSIIGCGGAGSADAGVTRAAPGASPGPCRVGDTRPMPRVSEEEASGVRPVTDHVVVGCGRLPNGGVFELVGYRQSNSQGGHALCLDVHVLPRGPGFGCGDERLPPGRDIELQGTGAGRRTVVLAGSASLNVGSVVARIAGSPKSQPHRATLVRVTQTALLRRLRPTRPFAYYVTSLPASAVRSGRVVIEANDEHGRLVDKLRVRPR